jgi:hypothetical protein
LGISREGKVVIGSNDDFTSYLEFFRVEGNSKIHGTLDTTGAITSDGSLAVGGISTLTGDVTVDGKIFAKGGLDVDGPYTVSGLTNEGTLTTEGNEASQHLLSLTYREKVANAEDIIHEKGSIHLDGFMNTNLHLGDQNDSNWVSITPSGSYMDTEDFAIGTRLHPETNLFGTTLTTQGQGPGIILRNTNTLTEAEKLLPVGSNNQDWYVGTGQTGLSEEYNKLFIGRFNGSPNAIQHMIQLSPSGKISFGSNVATLDDYTYTFQGDIYNGSNFTTAGTIKTKSLEISKDSVDTEYSAGFNYQGRLSIRMDRQDSYNLAVEDKIAINGSSNPGLIFTSNQGEKAGLQYNSALSTLELVNDAEVVLSVSTSGVGVSTTRLTSENILANKDIVVSRKADIQNLDVTGITTLKADSTTYVEGDFYISGNTASKFEVLTSGENIDLPGVKNSSFYVGVGTYGTNGAGLKVLTEDGTATVPANIRLYDIGPYAGFPNIDDTLITVKWNWEKIEGTGNVGTDLSGVDFFQFTPTEGAAAWRKDSESAGSFAAINADHLVGKRWTCTTSTGTSTFTITAINTTTGMIDVAPLVVNGEDGADYDGATPIGPNYSKVVEEADAIHIQCVEMTGGGSHLPGMIMVSNEVPFDMVEENVFAFRLPRNVQTYKYMLRLQASRGPINGDWNIMPVGSFDPDHSEAGVLSGQAIVNYGLPFRNDLP